MYRELKNKIFLKQNIFCTQGYIKIKFNLNLKFSIPLKYFIVYNSVLDKKTTKNFLTIRINKIQFTEMVYIFQE